MSVGQELLEVPLPDMVYKLAYGIAQAQKALDQNSIETAKALADKNNMIPIVPAVTETITKEGKIEFTEADPVNMTLLQVGLNPTFYQFSETTIEVEMDIKTSSSTEETGHLEAEVTIGFSIFSVSVKMDYSFNRKFGREVHGSSKMVVKMVPVPPPPRLLPKFEVVDEREKPKAPSE